MVRCLFSDMIYKMLKAACMNKSEQKYPRAGSKQGNMFYGFEGSKSRDITEVLTSNAELFSCELSSDFAE